MKVHQFIVDKAPQLFKADMKVSKPTLSQPTDEGNSFSVVTLSKLLKKMIAQQTSDIMLLIMLIFVHL
jgi:hypothetical protein